MNIARSNCGFSTIEVLVAIGILSIAIYGMSSVFGQLDAAKNGAMGRALQVQLQSQVSQILSSPSDCIKNLVSQAQGPGVPANITIPNVQTFDLYDSSATGASPVFKSGMFYQGSNFSITLEFPNPTPFETVIAGVERPTSTSRYLANLVINKTKAAGAKVMGSPISVSRIPIMIELDSRNNLFSCTTRPENVEDSLYTAAGSTAHSIRDCYKIGGVPYPSSLGLICRTPLGAVNTVVPGPRAQQPALVCPNGWTIAKVSGIPLTTTLIRDLNLPPAQCPTRASKCQTGWHSMAPINPATEWCQAEGDAGGSGSTSSFPILGATIAGFAMYAYILNMATLAALPAALVGTTLGAVLVGAGNILTAAGAALASNPIGWAILAFFVILAIFGGSGDSCAPAAYPVQFSQPIAIGCF